MSDPFEKPAPEILRYFEAKGLKPSFHWQDIGFDEHALAFTVAKSAGYDVLADIRAAVGKAIEQRQEFADFKKELEPVLRAKGWWGKTQAADPATGQITDVQLGSDRRLRTIYWANIRTAYAAGAWERAWRTRRVLPYLIYVESVAEHKRPLHLSWVGTILPVEHDWWYKHYPPNGWNCQCRTRQASESEARAKGYDPDKAAPDDGDVSFVNKRTGEVTRVPNGIDPGWAQNPGATRVDNISALLDGKLNSMNPEARRVAATDLAGSWLARRIISGDVPYVRGSADPANIERGKITTPLAYLPENLSEQIGATTGIVKLSVADAMKQFDKRRTREGELSVKPGDYPVLQALIDKGEVIRQGQADLVLQGTDEKGKYWIAILRRAASALNEIYLKSFHRTTEDKLQNARDRGEVIRKGSE